MSYHITVADTLDLRLAEHAVRWDVFVCEQHVPFVLEIDSHDFDPRVIHLVALPDEAYGQQALGCVRILTDSPGHYHLGRLAVRAQARGMRLGHALVEAVHDYVAKSTPCSEEACVVLNAQLQAQGFYERAGYRATSRAVFLDAGIEHQEMIRVVAGRAAH
ncbi:GNAT family N-acetyltransferase [Schaalia suimastitidis]|uniref:GNAT family N-acetyltransferase n=1 Tax=Schaalia suimastitidis TaxID=121163 RepID=UPI0004184B76|nr:GNAT family N-acetyltransferase [Schaalia suimastitidis]